VNFLTSPHGDVDKVTMSLDEAEATFARKAETLAPETLRQLAGTYETPSGGKFQVAFTDEGGLKIVFPGQPDLKLIPWKGLQFRVTEFADLVFEFVMDNGQVKGLKQRDPSGEMVFPKK